MNGRDNRYAQRTCHDNARASPAACVLLLAFLLLALAACQPAQRQSTPAQLPEAGAPGSTASYASLPLGFEPNQGQTALELAGTDPAAKFMGLAGLPGKVNYYIGNDPSRWRTGIPTYTQVRVADAWTGADALYYGSQRQLEVDFVVAAGADRGPSRCD